jgi:hypothetical protein
MPEVSLSLGVSPWGEVWWQDRLLFRGTRATVSLPPGRHVLRLVHPESTVRRLCALAVVPGMAPVESADLSSRRGSCPTTPDAATRGGWLGDAEPQR